MSTETGANKVFAMDIHPDQLEFAIKFGASLSPEEMSDVIFDTTGISSAMEKGI